MLHSREWSRKFGRVLHLYPSIKHLLHLYRLRAPLLVSPDTRCACVLSFCSPVALFVTPWTVAPPGSYVHGILQVRILEWVDTPSSGGSSWPRDQTCVSSISCIGRQILYCCAIWEALINIEIFYCCRFFLWRGWDNNWNCIMTSLLWSCNSLSLSLCYHHPPTKKICNNKKFQC